jgi:hypothetical protein
LPKSFRNYIRYKVNIIIPHYGICPNCLGICPQLRQFLPDRLLRDASPKNIPAFPLSFRKRAFPLFRENLKLQNLSGTCAG